MTDSKNYKHWIKYAENDLAVAKDLQLQKNYVYQAVVLHCQQAVEKFLKAYLLYNNKKIIYTHDLLILCKLSSQIDETFNSFENTLNELSLNYREARYPDDFEDLDLQDASNALAIATEFEIFILPKFDNKK
jgi:HEPN domain-containing protein